MNCLHLQKEHSTASELNPVLPLADRPVNPKFAGPLALGVLDPWLRQTAEREGGGTACSPRLGADKVLVSDPDDGTYYGYRYNSESNGLAAIETGSANWYDLDHSYTDGEWAFGATSGTSLDVNRSGVETTISTVASMRTVQVSLRDQAVYIAAVDSSGDAWLVYGSPVSGVFTEVAMETGLTQPVLDVDVIASSADTLLFSARSATELAVMGVSLK